MYTVVCIKPIRKAVLSEGSKIFVNGNSEGDKLFTNLEYKTPSQANTNWAITLKPTEYAHKLPLL
jgi:hypothetical protein